MIWSTLSFRRHKGKSLPQIMFQDADWFFHAYENGYFKNGLASEAHEIYRRARSIKVPQRDGRKMLVEYIIHSDRNSRSNGKFGTMRLIAEGPGLANLNVAKSIDFYIPRSYARRDKIGYKNFVSSLKVILFGNPSKRMNRKACEDFFNDNSNFD